MIVKFDWNSDRIDQLKSLIALGLSASKIAGRMGASRASVLGKARRLQIPIGGGRASIMNASERARVSKPKPKPKKTVPAFRFGGAQRDIPVEGAEGAKKILDLRPSDCRWIVSGEAADALFCCKPMVSGAYCQDHAARAYRRGE